MEQLFTFILKFSTQHAQHQVSFWHFQTNFGLSTLLPVLSPQQPEHTPCTFHSLFPPSCVSVPVSLASSALTWHLLSSFMAYARVCAHIHTHTHKASISICKRTQYFCPSEAWIITIHGRYGTKEMAQQLRQLALTEDLSSVLSTQLSILQFKDPTPFSDLHRCQAHTWYTDIFAGKNSYTYNLRASLFIPHFTSTGNQATSHLLRCSAADLLTDLK